LNSWHSAIFRTTLWLTIAVSSSAQADRSGYDKVVNLVAETGTVRAEHHHDWSHASHNALWKMISTTKDPFTADNDYSYLRLVDKSSGVELFRRPVPALTHIWISPDSEYVVGISNVMSWNPYQLVVFDKSGGRLLERNMVGVNWPGVWRSVSTWIKWYKEPAPQMTIIKDGASVSLSIEDALGVSRQFQFPAVR
jgi:hypothetical protein